MKHFFELIGLTMIVVLSAMFWMGADRVVAVSCDQDLDAIVNADDPSIGTRFQLEGGCTYPVDTMVVLNEGDEIAGPPGLFIERPPAFDPEPTVTIVGSEGLSNVISAQGTVHLEWVKIVGGTGQYAADGSPLAGTGSGLAMGLASDTSSLYAVHITGSDGAGITNAHGTFDRIELDDTTQDPNFLGFIGSGLKAITEVEVRNSYIHDNQGNGLWCDVFCHDSVSHLNGFWVHDNLVVNNGRAGIRFEQVGDVADAGEALIENNEVHGNSAGALRGGVSIHDAQNALVRNNVFGATIIADVGYLPNSEGVAIRATDSGRSDRPDLWNVDIEGNVLNGEVIKGCESPDEILYCSEEAAPAPPPGTTPPLTTTATTGTTTGTTGTPDTTGNTNATPAMSTFTPLETVTNVRDFGATGDGTSNDTAAFERAMAEAARVGGVVYVPAPGNYRIASVTPPNNTHLEVQAGAVLKKYGTKRGPLFNIEGPNDTTFANNIHIEGVGGTFTMDLNDAGQETSGIRYRNVRNFSLRNMVCIQNNDNHLQEAPSSRRPCLAFLPTTMTPTNGVYNHPIDGEFSNVHSKKSPYGWGLTQLTGGENLRFFDISSEGGVPLRLESYRNNWTPIDNIVADGVRCTNGHDAVHMNPHGVIHGTVTIQNVVADSCESALSLKQDSALGGSFASDSTISGVTVMPGKQAQLRDDATTGHVGAWVIGPSRWCIDNDNPLGYTIGLSNVDCGGLSNRRP